jgi:hypothetical protein
MLMDLNTFKAAKLDSLEKENIKRSIELTATGTLAIYPFDKTATLSLSRTNSDILDTVAKTVVDNNLDWKYYPADNTIIIWNSDSRKASLMKEADIVRRNMEAKVERDQHLFLEKQNLKTRFTTQLHYRTEWVLLAKEIFEPLGFVVKSRINENDIWVEEPEE